MFNILCLLGKNNYRNAVCHGWVFVIYDTLRNDCGILNSVSKTSTRSQTTVEFFPASCRILVLNYWKPPTESRRWLTDTQTHSHTYIYTHTAISLIHAFKTDKVVQVPIKAGWMEMFRKWRLMICGNKYIVTKWPKVFVVIC